MKNNRGVNIESWGRKFGKKIFEILSNVKMFRHLLNKVLRCLECELLTSIDIITIRTNLKLKINFLKTVSTL